LEALATLVQCVLVDLPGLNLPLKVIKLFHRQASKEFDAAPYLKSGLKKMLASLLVRTLEWHRVRDTPVGRHRRAGKYRAPLARIVGDRDDEIKMDSGKIMPRFAAGARGVFVEVFLKNFEDKRVDSARRRFAATIDLKTISADRAKETFGEDTAVGVSSAEKENAEFRAHRSEGFQTDTPR
jgi:hypothetical protein